MNFTRRHLMKSAALAAIAPTLARAQTAPKPRAVVLVYLNGGYNALFSSPQAFAAAGSFAVSSTNIKSLGNNVWVDDATYGQMLPSTALSHLATVGVNHHLSSHPAARASHWIGPNGRSNPLILAKAMGGATAGATLPCVVVGSGTPEGSSPAEGGVTLQRASDLGPALELFGASTAGMLPSRRAALAGMRAAKVQSAPQLGSSQVSLKSANEAYDGAISVLGGTVPSFSLGNLQTYYGVTGTAVTSFTAQMMAADAMINLGSKVVIAISNAGWDTHGDINGSTVRSRMSTGILPGLSKFLSNPTGAYASHDVTVAIFGDFARSLPGSDHASCLAATVIGPHIKVGTTGNVDAQVGMSAAPGTAGFWSLLAAASGVSVPEFGANPHASLLM